MEKFAYGQLTFQDICRFQVAMQDATGMDVVQALCYLQSHLQHAGPLWQPALLVKFVSQVALLQRHHQHIICPKVCPSAVCILSGPVTCLLAGKPLNME